MAVPPVSSLNSARNRLVHSTRSVDFAGLHGETCYILVVDHHTGYYLGDPRVSKASPINWLHRYMETHSPSCAEAGSSGKVYAFYKENDAADNSIGRASKAMYPGVFPSTRFMVFKERSQNLPRGCRRHGQRTTGQRLGKKIETVVV
jgi:hypothetical protein